jgi:hypothetical protein
MRTNFKLLSVSVILSTAIVTPVFAQQAVSEPGVQAFYQNLGVGSQSSAPSAMASARLPSPVRLTRDFVAKTISLSYFCGKYTQLHVFAEPF